MAESRVNIIVNMEQIANTLPFISETKEPPSFFIRPGYNVHCLLEQVLSERNHGTTGIVIEAHREERHLGLRRMAEVLGIWTVLDPMEMQLAFDGGFAQLGDKIDWANGKVHDSARFTKSMIDSLVDQIGSFAIEKGFSAIISPCHFLDSAGDDSWLEIDCSITTKLRKYLNENGADEVKLFYPLALHLHDFTDAARRKVVLSAIRGLPVDAIWLRLHPFGSTHRAPSVKAVMDARRSLMGLSVPVIGEKVGEYGLPLVAFGALGGIETGVGTSDKFTVQSLKQVRKKTDSDKKRKGGSPQRIFLPDLGIYLSKEMWGEFRKVHGTAKFGCRDSSCCKKGIEAMIRNPKRHCFIQSQLSLAEFSQIPDSLRPGHYLDNFLRPSVDSMAGVISKLEGESAIHNKIEKKMKKKMGLLETLSLYRRNHFFDSSVPPLERRLNAA